MSTRSQPSSIRVMSSRGSPIRSPTESIFELAHSSNTFAAGIGEVLQVLAASSRAPSTKPLMVEFGNRVMAMGRQRLSGMNGKNAMLYMKSKFGLLNSTSAVYLQATFESDEDRFVEVDLDSWEELVGYMSRLRIIT